MGALTIHGYLDDCSVRCAEAAACDACICVPGDAIARRNSLADDPAGAANVIVGSSQDKGQGAHGALN